MTDTIHAITGATGALGSHIAEQLAGQGTPVRGLVRPGSDRSFLTKLGCELVEGDLMDPVAARKLVSGASHVFHCAARTDNWGDWSAYEQGNVVTTKNLVDACLDQPDLQRLVHLSSIAVYGHPIPQAGQIIDESAELEQHPWLWDYYAGSKVRAEKLVQQLGGRATVIRPTSFFGVRDMAFLPRLMRTIANGGMWLFGPGDNLQNVLYVADVADLAVRAAAADQAAGQTYNCCSSGDITQREFIACLCEAMGRPPVRRRIPVGIARGYAFGLECFGKLVGRKQTPPLTRHALSVFLRPTHFSHQKAKRDLGWEQRISTREGIEQTCQWLQCELPDLF